MSSLFPTSRWSVLVASMLLELCGGSVYITNLYLAALRPRLFPGAADGEALMEYLVFASNLGNWVPLAGFLYDARRGGPRTVVFAGAALTLLGYGGLWLCSAFDVHANFAVLWLLWFLWGHGSGYFDCAAIATCSANFRESRGLVLGLTKSFYGLSGSLLTQVFLAFFAAPDAAPAFLLFLGVALCLLALALAPLVRRLAPPRPLDADSPSRRFARGYALVGALAVAMVAISLLRAFSPLAASRAFSLGALGLVAASLLALPSLAWGAAAAAGSPSVGSSSVAGRVGLLEEADAAAARRESGAGPTQHAQHAPQGPPLQLSPPPDGQQPGSGVWASVASVDFGLLFVAAFAGWGGGIVLLNHIGKIVTAAAPAQASSQASPILVSLLSACNCIGRMAAGACSDALSRRRVPRPHLLAAATCLMGAAHAALLGAASPPLLYLGAAAGGAAYGAVWSLLPSIVGDIFPARHFATVYNLFSLAASSSSLLLSTLLATKVYAAHAHVTTPGAAAECHGSLCYRATHLAILGACAAGTAGALALGVRNRAIYRGKLLDRAAV